MEKISTRNVQKKVIAVTNRKLCRGDFLTQIEHLCQGGVGRIILREKDLSEEAYEALARQVLAVCADYGTECSLHSFVNVAERLHARAIHLPLPVAKSYVQKSMLRRETMSAVGTGKQCSCENQREKPGGFETLGISIHSVEEAKEAEACGASYLTAWHIFLTDCKKGLPGRGLEFLREVADQVEIPVFAIGGITGQNAQQVMACGASGVCVMSGFMNVTVEEIKKFCYNLS